MHKSIMFVDGMLCFNNNSEKNLDTTFTSDLSKQKDQKCYIERDKSQVFP